MGRCFKFMKEEEILGILPLHIRTINKSRQTSTGTNFQEIRLAHSKVPVILKYNAKTCYLPNRERSQQEKNNYIS